MADPITKKIDTLPAMTDLIATNDKLLLLDVSASAADMTKLMTMSQVRISNAAQLDSGVVENAKIADAAVTLSKMAANSIDSDQYVDGSIDRVHLAADIVDGTKIADDAVDSEHIKDGAIDLAHMSVNSIDSDQYVDGSIDTVHLANDAVTEAKLGAIKRTVAIPLFGWDDVVIGKTFTNVFRWPTMLDGHNVTGARAVVQKAVSSSGNITLTITNAGGTMSTITINAGAVAGTSTIATAYKAATQDEPVTVVVAYSGNTAKGLTLYLEVTG
jgi:hypothetical protein